MLLPSEEKGQAEKQHTYAGELGADGCVKRRAGVRHKREPLSGHCMVRDRYGLGCGSS